MKTILLTAAAALVLASISPALSFAQQNGEDEYQSSQNGGYQSSNNDGYGAHYRDYGRPDRGNDQWRGMNSTMSRRGGARFRFRRGDASINIRCPQNDSLQNCVEAASRLIDKVHGLAMAPEDKKTPAPPPETKQVPGSSPSQQ